MSFSTSTSRSGQSLQTRQPETVDFNDALSNFKPFSISNTSAVESTQITLNGRDALTAGDSSHEPTMTAVEPETELQDPFADDQQIPMSDPQPISPNTEKCRYEEGVGNMGVPSHPPSYQKRTSLSISEDEGDNELYRGHSATAEPEQPAKVNPRPEETKNNPYPSDEESSGSDDETAMLSTVRRKNPDLTNSRADAKAAMARALAHSPFIW